MLICIQTGYIGPLHSRVAVHGVAEAIRGVQLCSAGRGRARAGGGGARKPKRARETETSARFAGCGGLLRGLPLLGVLAFGRHSNINSAYTRRYILGHDSRFV